MAKVTTTLSGAFASSDQSLGVASATGIVAGYMWKCDQEWGVVLPTYVSGTSVPVRRGGQNGSVQDAHPSGANITFGLPSDFDNPNATVVVAYPLSGLRRKLVSYSASGAITLPTSGEDMIAVLNGTSTLAMTIAAPPKDIDGSMLWVVGNGAAAHTIQFTGGLSGAGASYDVVTVNATAPIALLALAVNGLWIAPVGPAMTGTVTNITGGVA